MSTKPTLAATWDSNGTNVIAPTSGHKDDGFAVDEVPSSSEVNGQLKLIGEWTEWLKDFTDASGRINTVHRNWSNSTEQISYTTSVGGTAAGFLSSDSTLLQGGHLRLRVTALGDLASGRNGAVMIPPQLSGHVQVLEFSVDSTSFVSTDGDCFLGLMEITAYDNNKGGVFFIKNSAGSNWKASVNAGYPGPATITDTGVAAAGLQKMKIVWAGSDYSGGPYAKFYIDGTLVHTATSNLPDDNTDYMYIIFELLGLGAVDAILYISPFTWRQAHNVADGNTLL